MVICILFASNMMFLGGCGEVESNVANDVLNEEITDLESADIVFSGIMTGQNGYSTTGEISIYYKSDTDQYSLVLDNFSSDDGPALFVYLSQGNALGNAINLGALKALSGTVRYDFSGNQFDPAFDHVLVWCDRVSRNFGEARLEP